MDKKLEQPHSAETELRADIEARTRLMECMQDLIKGLGQANSHLAHELGKRREMTHELVSEGVVKKTDDASGIDDESLVIKCGTSAVLSLPKSEDWVSLPPTEQNESASALSKTNGKANVGILVSRWKPLPSLVQLGRVLAGLPERRQSSVMEMVIEVVCRELADSVLLRDPMIQVQNSIRPGIAVCDPAGSIRLANQKFCRLSGEQRNNLTGNPLAGLFRALDSPTALLDPVRDLHFDDVCFRSGDASPVSIKLMTRPLHAGSKHAGSVAVVMDQSKQHDQIEDLANKERFYRRFFEEDVTGDYSCTPDGKIIACNPAFARIFGFSSVEEAAKCNLRQLHVNGESADHFLDTLRRQRKLSYYESVMRRVDGKHIHVIRNVHGNFDTDGKLIEITGYIFDNTEQRQLEEKVRKSQKMESVGRLAGGIAHDFNNLILAIQGYAELLEDQIPKDSEGSEAIKQIQKASDRATVLTRQLLAFSRRQVLQPTKLNLNEVISGMSSLLQRMLGEDVDLVANLDSGLHFVRADRGQVEQVLVNLASNARDAMPEGGRLTVATTNVELRDTWFDFHDGPPPGEYVELTVRDDGVGMSDEVKSHLFEPFFTTKDRGKGVGLGLSTVYGIIKQSGGEIQAYSQHGEGTEFKVYLPRLEEVELESEEVPADNTVARTNRTVLLVEDEESVRTLVHKILEKNGFTIIDAFDGKDALSKMEDYAGETPLLLTDLIMPRMSGRELYERLQPQFDDMEVIYMSGYTEDEVIKRGVMLEKVNFLQKPFNPAQLIGKVNQVLQIVDGN